MSTAIEMQEVWKIYRQRLVEVQALRGVSLSLENGAVVAITGPSGSGKSTLLHLLGALDSPSRGQVRILGEEVAAFSDDRLAAFRRRHLGFVFQFFNLLPTLSARENTMLPLLLDGMARRKAGKRADELLEKVGLGERRDHRPDELSGGQQQRVAIARALVARPDLLLADEPTGNLDSKAGAEILDLLEEVRARDGLGMVLVTHDEQVALRAHRVIHLIDGRVAWDRATDDIETSPSGRFTNLRPPEQSAP